jgi:hypothetical protein
VVVEPSEKRYWCAIPEIIFLNDAYGTVFGDVSFLGVFVVDGLLYSGWLSVAAQWGYA